MEKDTKPATTEEQKVEPVKSGSLKTESGASHKQSPLLWAGIIVAVIVIGGGLFWHMNSQTAKPLATQRTLKIGLITADAPNQSDSITGETLKAGVILAQKQIHVDGVTVEIIAKGTRCDKKLVPPAMEDFVKQGVVAVIGEECSSATLAGVPIANAHHIVMISPASTSPKLTTDGGEYFFRTIPSDALAGAFTANYIYTQGKVRNLAIIYSNETYGMGLRDSVTQNFEKLGGKVVDAEGIEDNVTVKNTTATITAAIVRIKAAKPDAIYMASNFGGSGVTAMLKIQELKLNVPIYGSEAIGDAAYASAAGGAAEGIKVINVSQGTPDFIEKSHAAWGTDPNTFSAQSYDAYAAIMKAVAAGAYTGEAIHNALRQVEFDGASGHIKFDQHGDIAGNYSIFTIKNGKLVQLSQ